MDELHFKKGDIEVTVESTLLEDGNYAVQIRTIGDKDQVNAFMKDLINGTAELNLPIELKVGKVGSELPVKVSDLMGGN